MKTRMVCIGVCVVCILFTCTHATSPIVWNTGRHEVFPPTRVAAGVAVVKQVPALKSVVSTSGTVALYRAAVCTQVLKIPS